MVHTTTATFENGVFKPDAIMDLPTGAKVQLTVTPCQDSHADSFAAQWASTFEQRQRALGNLDRLRAQHPIDTRGERMTRDELHERG